MGKWKNDIILMAIVIVIAALVWLGIDMTRIEGAYVVVTVGGEVYGEYPLNIDAEILIGDENTYNLLVIKNGEAQIEEASCPDKLCVNQGKISYDGQSIICLPNKVVVEVVGGKRSEFDAVAK